MPEMALEFDISPGAVLTPQIHKLSLEVQEKMVIILFVCLRKMLRIKIVCGKLSRHKFSC